MNTYMTVWRWGGGLEVASRLTVAAAEQKTSVHDQKKEKSGRVSDSWDILQLSVGPKVNIFNNTL